MTAIVVDRPRGAGNRPTSGPRPPTIDDLVCAPISFVPFGAIRMKIFTVFYISIVRMHRYLLWVLSAQ